MLTRTTLLALFLGFVTLGPVEAQPVNVSGARLEAAWPPLADRLGGDGWIAYSVPLVADAGNVCCFDTDGDRMGCTLGRGGGFRTFGRVADHARSEPGDRLLVFLAPDGSGGRRVRAYDSACPIDADGLPIAWLGDVPPAESIAVLAGLVGEEGRSDHEPLAAIAHHAGGEATAFLARLARDNAASDKRRGTAAFWLGAQRGDDGYRVLVELLERFDRPSLREELAVAFAQSKNDAAIDDLIVLARGDRSPRVRGAALFWLAQTASRRVPRVLVEAAERDPDTSVKKKAVFAVSQLPADRGVPLLIDMARDHPSAAVRQQAIFWLGQTENDEALAFVISLLDR